MQREAAETLALNALGWLAGHDELLPIFLGSTGASAEDLRTRANDAYFLGSVLDFVLIDDAWVLEFAAKWDIRPEQVQAARQALPGGESVHWT